ncbi:MAG: hypothetical protein DWI57_13625, partial [Chloroflexi bacterium]
DLPAIVLDVQSDGSVSVGNVPIAQLGAMAGADLSTVAIDPAMVEFMSAGNIQHVQVNNSSSGLLLLVNGEAIPSISYDGESLQATADALNAFGMAVPMLDTALSLVDQIGLGIIMRFPVAAGASEIPLYVEGDGGSAAEAKMAQDEFLAAVGAPPRVNLPIFYEADGSFSIGDLSDEEWSALTGASLAALRLNTSVLEGLAASGISKLGIGTDAAGIHIMINDSALPTLDWSGGKATHLLNIADQLGLWEMLAPGMNIGEVLATVEGLLPVIQVADFDLTVHLPGSGVATK